MSVPLEYFAAIGTLLVSAIGAMALGFIYVFRKVEEKLAESESQCKEVSEKLIDYVEAVATLKAECHSLRASNADLQTRYDRLHGRLGVAQNRE